MSKVFSLHTTHQSNRKQAFALLIIGVLSLLGALLLRSNPYPVGIFVFGLGMLISTLFNPYRLMTAGILMTTIGISIYLAYSRTFIPSGGSTLYLAIAVGLLAIAFAARRGYIGAGAITPALLVLVVGLIEYPPAAHLLPSNYVAFLLSLWLPAIGLLALGVVYLLLGRRK